MKHFLMSGGVSLLAISFLTGCIDKNYDLSDIDTTSEIVVTDLVLPLNLDPITLGDIIDLKDGEQIKEVAVDGKTFYAVQESGTFESDPISIPGFSAAAPVLAPAVSVFAMPQLESRTVDISSGPLTLPITEPINKTVDFSATGIDASIMEISDIFTDNFHISLGFTASSELSEIAEVEMTDLYISMPKGLTVKEILPSGTYEDGVLKVPSLKLVDGKGRLSLQATLINLPANNSGIDYNTHSLNLKTEVNIESANLVISAKDNTTAIMPTEVTLNIDYTISPLDVKAVSGKIRYLLEGDNLSISPIALSDLPEFLSGDETNLVLANPQIYLSVNNPVADEGLRYRSGIQLTAVRENSEPRTYSLDRGYFTVGYDKGISGPYNFCLSPSAPANVLTGYENPEWEPFSDLGYVISGNGLPQSIAIKLVDPQIYEQTVKCFSLNQELKPLKGTWDFLAPLAMKEGNGSRIIYTKTNDGWNDEDIDAITIKSLELSMNVTNNTPLSATITGYPVDIYGKQIPGVTIEGAEIPGSAKDTPVTIRITGEIKHLDGLTFSATISPKNSEALAPDQTITLTNVKAKVSGNYTKKL